MKTTILTLSMMIFVGCGYDPEQYQTEDELAEEETTTEEEPDLVLPDEPEDEQTTNVNTNVKVEVDVDVCVGAEDYCSEEGPELLRVGLKMDQVEHILGRPDDSNLTASGMVWHYDNYDGVCEDDRDSCAVYFDEDRKVFSSYGIHPDFKDYRSL